MSAPRDVTPVFYRFSFANFFAPGVFVIIFSLLLIGVFSAVKAILKLISGLNIGRGRGKRVPNIGRTVVDSTVNAATNTLLNDSAVAACIRDTSKITRNNGSNLASFFINLVFVLDVFLTPVFLLVPDTTADNTLMVINMLVVSSFGGVRLRSVSRSFPTFVAVVAVILYCDVTSNVYLNVLDCILVGVVINGFGSLGLALCVLDVFLLFGCIFDWVGQ